MGIKDYCGNRVYTTIILFQAARLEKAPDSMAARPHWHCYLNSLLAWQTRCSSWCIVLQSYILWFHDWEYWFNPQSLLRSYSVLFVANSISTIIKMHTMHPHSISVISVGTTLALIILLLVYQPMSLQNTTQVYIILYCWIYTSCSIYQMHSMMLVTVRYLICYIWHPLAIQSFM